MRNLGKNRVLWIITSGLAFVASCAGVAKPAIYDSLVSSEILPATISQDLVAMVLSAAVLLLSIRVKEGEFRKQVAILGVHGFYFYAYGIYVIEQIYTVLYLVYMAVLGLSFYTVVYGLVNLEADLVQSIRLPGKYRRLSLGLLALTPLVFYPLWVSQIIPLLGAGRKLEFLFSIYILDICFIMPLFIIEAYLTARNMGLGLLTSPALFITGFGVLAPLSLGEAMKPCIYDMPMDVAGMTMFLVLSVSYLAMAVLDLRSLSTYNRDDG